MRTFFGRSLSVVTVVPVGQVERKRLVSRDAIGWPVSMRMSGHVECNFSLSKESHFSRINRDSFMNEGQQGVR